MRAKPVITVVTNNSEYGTVSGGNTVNVGEKITIVATPTLLREFMSRIHHIAYFSNFRLLCCRLYDRCDIV